jgi:hypothetical protein
MTDPILAVAAWTEDNKQYRLKVKGGLHYMRGNSKPYFSLTADEYENGRDVAGGCMHDDIEAHFPGRFTDLIRMHLSSSDGVPLHVLENGYYSLSGALGGAGERFHGGNGTPNHTEAECLQIFADHCRIPVAEAQAIADDVRAAWGPMSEEGISPWSTSDYKRGREVWRQRCEAMRERWGREAVECIQRHKLKLYGEPWREPIAGME